MIGIIPAAGKGTRLNAKCKALVLDPKEKYLIENSLENMQEIGVNKIIIIQHGDEIFRTIGKDYCKIPIEYVEQKEQTGIADAVSLTKEKVGNEDIVIIFADIIYKGRLAGMRNFFQENDLDCMVGSKNVVDRTVIQKSYGYNLYKSEFVEKPDYVDGLAFELGLGIYMAKANFFEHIKETRANCKTWQKEITDVLNTANASSYQLKGFYINVNTPEDLEKLK